MERSLKEKIGYMNYLGLKLADLIDQNIIDYNKLTDKESELIYTVADGLSEDYVIRNITGQCSLKSMLENSLEVLENYVDNKIQGLIVIFEKYQITGGVTNRWVKKNHTHITI